MRAEGTPLDAEELEESDVILPPPDTSFMEASAEFTGDGLIPDYLPATFSLASGGRRAPPRARPTHGPLEIGAANVNAGRVARDSTALGRLQLAPTTAEFATVPASLGAPYPPTSPPNRR